jgi:dephospho-CoA kinase
VIRVLITGMSGTGKSSLVGELRRLGYAAYDADDDGYTERRPHGGWGWRAEAVQELVDRSTDPVLFFSGCSEEQSQFEFDLRVLLTASESVMVERLACRETNSYGRTDAELERILSDRTVVEPLLRRTADLVVDTEVPVEEVAAVVVGRVAGLLDAGGG